MPHSPDDKKRAISRLRRIRGQTEALERAVLDGVDCRALLQQIAALRGAANGLMAEVLDSHLRELFGSAQQPAARAAADPLRSPARATAEPPHRPARASATRADAARANTARSGARRQGDGTAGSEADDEIAALMKTLRTYLR